MYVLTFKGLPAPAARVFVARSKYHHTTRNMRELLKYDTNHLYIAAPQRKRVLDRFLSEFCFPWKDAVKMGFRIERFDVMLSPRSRAAAAVVRRAKELAAAKRRKDAAKRRRK